jgi:hypothetical protein
MNIESIRAIDNIKNFYAVVVDGIEMRLACYGNPWLALEKLFGVNNG